jgi:hypothetical protein
MSRLLAACALVAFACPALADDKDKPKPNTLTAKEIADGWILLFDGETTFGWKSGARKTELAVKDGALVITGAKGEAQLTTRFHAFELTGEYRVRGPGGQFSLVTVEPAPGSAVVSFPSALEPGDRDGWQKLGARSSAKDFSLFAGDPGKPEISGPGLLGNGIAAVWFTVPDAADGRIELRNLKLRPLETRPLFTGKGLDGWKVNAADPKRMASKWEVTEDGELSLKNGPGDLVTEKEFDNFILQLECKTLGKNLNSGVFFRCIPGQYQNGYEAQIHNGLKGDDRTKPLDFGTGAIYRRVPARKVVADDNEWFTMTVVADGKHFATWVNGYQTVDWTDERKENDNPRNGYRAAKGPISLQGHDPTTDILFRNIRIAELAEKQN